MRAFGIFLVLLLCATPSLPQGSERIRNSFGNLSPEQVKSILETRRLAQRGLDLRSSAFATPSIAKALGFPAYLIAVARIADVRFTGQASSPTRIAFHVEQFLRGDSQVTDFDAKSRWRPEPATKPEHALIGFPEAHIGETVLDRREPRKGERYVLGYTLEYGNRNPVYIDGAVDLKDPAQSELVRNVLRFLSIETDAEQKGVGVWLDALDNNVPWIRDIAVHRLTESDACNVSPACAERFSADVERYLKSNSPNERLEAVYWLAWIDSVARVERIRKGWLSGLPILPDSKLRALFNSAIQDSNVVVGDKAYEEQQVFEAYRRESPGKCFVVVPELRKSVFGDSRINLSLSAGFPFIYTYGCVSRQ